MINSLSILFSLVVVLFVIVRAAALDAKRPWFERAPPPGPPEPNSERGQLGRGRTAADRRRDKRWA